MWNMYHTFDFVTPFTGVSHEAVLVALFLEFLDLAAWRRPEVSSPQPSLTMRQHLVAGLLAMPLSPLRSASCHACADLAHRDCRLVCHLFTCPFAGG